MPKNMSMLKNKITDCTNNRSQVFLSAFISLKVFHTTHFGKRIIFLNPDYQPSIDNMRCIQIDGHRERVNMSPGLSTPDWEIHEDLEVVPGEGRWWGWGRCDAIESFLQRCNFPQGGFCCLEICCNPRRSTDPPTPHSGQPDMSTGPTLPLMWDHRLMSMESIMQEMYKCLCPLALSVHGFQHVECCPSTIITHSEFLNIYPFLLEREGKSSS